MPNESLELLRSFYDVLNRHGVEYIVIGGQAEGLMGSARPTYDTNLCHNKTAENLNRLATALHELKPTLRGAPKDLKFTIDQQSLALGNNFTFETAIGPLDLLAYVEPIGGYDDLIKNAETYNVLGLTVRTIGLDDLSRVKQHIRRAKDTESLFQLLQIKEIRSRQK